MVEEQTFPVTVQYPIQNLGFDFGVVESKGNVDDDFTVPQRLVILTTPQVELTGKIFSSDEKDFWQLPELVLKKQSNKYSIMSNNASYGKNLL